MGMLGLITVFALEGAENIRVNGGLAPSAATAQLPPFLAVRT